MAALSYSTRFSFYPGKSLVLEENIATWSFLVLDKQICANMHTGDFSLYIKKTPDRKSSLWSPTNWITSNSVAATKWPPFCRRYFWMKHFAFLFKLHWFVPNGPIRNTPSLFKAIACRWTGDKPLPESRWPCSMTYVCVTLPEWVSTLRPHGI